MLKVEEGTEYRNSFFMLYALTYMCNAVYMTFVPVYLNHIGFNQIAIGALLSLGPFIAILGQPIWGIAGDRAKTKNIVLQALLLGSAVVIALYPVSKSFYYLFVMMALFTFFQTSINPMSDAITLEYIEGTRWKFGPIRMSGTIGYAVMAVVAGVFAKQNITGIFILYFVIAMMAFGVSFRLPKVAGHQSEGQKVSMWRLFRHGKLVILMSFNLVIQITLGFYYSFFSIYYRQMGADNVLLGWSMFLSAISEVPFLLFADKILKRIGTKYTLIGSAVVTAVRWILLHFVTNPYMVLPIQVLHGLMFVVLTFSLATYINREVPKELKASGQALNGLIGSGVARIIGSLLGGVLSQTMGTRQVFLLNAGIVAIAVVVYGSIFILEDRRENRPSAL